ncbi:hypothetical protein DFP72DRAFT_901609 [Ephemerocybe angulata]|uniref:Uncharacterized protein n=1 Tax=Ephemerocybe angulata TaxID=980116 RepID=A0A8H6HVL7_9AGAR|nr:hypothetical protein DFP72DRAFT_901609 [Tulosesus angulatus]
MLIDMEVIYLSQVPATDRVLVLIARTHCAIMIRKFLGRGLGLRWGGGSSGPGSAGAAQASYLDWGALVLVSPCAGMFLGAVFWPGPLVGREPMGVCRGGFVSLSSLFTSFPVLGVSSFCVLRFVFSLFPPLSSCLISLGFGLCLAY